MKNYENPKCTHAFILHSFPIIKSLPIVSILYPFGSLMNFRIYTRDSLSFKWISHLTMVCYHQNRIERTLGLTILLNIISYFSSLINWSHIWKFIFLVCFNLIWFILISLSTLIVLVNSLIKLIICLKFHISILILFNLVHLFSLNTFIVLVL